MNSLKKNKKLIIFSLLLVIGILGYNQIFKEAKTTEEINTAFEGSSGELLTLLSAEDSQLNNKAVQITGVITSINSEGIIIDKAIFCQFAKPETRQQLKEQQKVKIKGIIVGYDDLLNELKLNQCIIRN
ncbi:hypothetical protein ACOSP6_04585 [Tenacibaculum sp. MEBiC06402]|uniref:hypothetical protein n=1 Tax=unclassified Tenacibaculum TaxID=2635139 RepID=UPI003B9A5964